MCSAGVRAANYSLVDLGTLGGNAATAVAINSGGQVTGYSDLTGNGGPDAFIYDGAMHDLGTLGGSSSFGTGINNNGQVVGNASTIGDTASDAFQYDGTMHDLGDWSPSGINSGGVIVGSNDVDHAVYYDGSLHDIGTLGGTYSSGNAINDNGLIAGDSDTSDGNEHAFLYDGSMHDLGTFGGDTSRGLAINATGMVAGWADTADGSAHAFLYDGTLHDLGTLGAPESAALGINSEGVVVGSVRTGPRSELAFVYDGMHGMQDLNGLIDPSLGWQLLSANGINDAGLITGIGFVDGQQHAFLLSPVPEPASLVLAALACISLMAIARRRHARQPLDTTKGTRWPGGEGSSKKGK